VTTAIQQTRYDQLLRRVAGIIGPGSKVSEVLSELFPMIDVENVPAELLILAGTRTCAGGGFQGATAAQAVKFQLFNPVDSGHIITITRVLHSADSTQNHRWGRSTAVFATTRSGAGEFTDTRNDIVNKPVAEIRELSEAALANAANLIVVPANEPLVLENENSIAVLSPGFGWEIGNQAVNTGGSVSFYWRERVAEQSELRL